MKRWKSKVARAGRRDYELMSENRRPTVTAPRKIVIKPHQISISPTRVPVSRILTATNEFWTETAFWESKGGIWRCVSGTGVLKRFVGMNRLEAKTELLKLDATWSWK